MMAVVRFVLFLIAFACVSTIVNAEIIKTASVCEKGVCFHWWPKLPDLKGWHQDKDQSLNENVNALTPDGTTFADSETVMYVNAVYKPRVPESKTLDGFIANDKKAFEDTDVQKTADLLTADGQKIATFRFAPKQSGNWETIGYGEENDGKGNEYFLVFAISSRSQAGLEKSMKDFKQLISLYKSAP